MNNLLKKNWFWLAAILTSGLILRLYLMSMLKCLTFDEIDSVSETNRPLGQIWSYIKWEMHPPLHFYYLHFWISAFGSSETALHWSSLVLSLAAIIVLYFLGKEIFKSSIAGLAAAVLYAWSSLFCFYGDWARMTTMLFLFAALSFLFFFKLLKARGRKIILFGALFTFFTLGALYTHLTAGLVPAIEFFYLLYLFFRRQNSSAEICKKFLAPALLILAGYAPWFWYFWQAKLKILGGNAWYFTAQGKTSLPYIVI
jgi:Predicted membrane protein